MMLMGRYNDRRGGWLAGLVCLSTAIPVTAADFSGDDATALSAGAPPAVIESPAEEKPKSPSRRDRHRPALPVRPRRHAPPEALSFMPW
jgi:hypothetical protein